MGPKSVRGPTAKPTPTILICLANITTEIAFVVIPPREPTPHPFSYKMKIQCTFPCSRVRVTERLHTEEWRQMKRQFLAPHCFVTWCCPRLARAVSANPLNPSPREHKTIAACMMEDPWLESFVFTGIHIHDCVHSQVQEAT